MFPKMTKHCLREYTNLGEILTEVYDKFKDTIKRVLIYRINPYI